MENRILTKVETEVVTGMTKSFLRSFVGESLIENSADLEKLTAKWQEQLDATMCRIANEFFQWFENQEE